MGGPPPRQLRTRLLAWFDTSHRDLPWRRTTDPYRILIAEYLLQRTRVVTGTPYYERFLERFPDVASLAAASEDDVLRAWEGLGYYRRARDLHAAARAIVLDHGGQIPSDAATLATLPGIGPYTAGAVASIAFGERVPAVDGNVTRVISRVFRVEADVTTSAGRRRIQDLASDLVPPDRPGPFNQALMELGANVCTPRRPLCTTCPLSDLCLARAAGVQASLPRIPQARRPRAAFVCFAYIRSRDEVLLVRRPSSGLLGGLWSFPGGELPKEGWPRIALPEMVAAQTGLHVTAQEEVARVAHVFSHRRWSGDVYRCTTHGPARLRPTARWVSISETLHLPMVPDHRRILSQLDSPRPLESSDARPHRCRG